MQRQGAATTAVAGVLEWKLSAAACTSDFKMVPKRVGAVTLIDIESDIEEVVIDDLTLDVDDDKGGPSERGSQRSTAGSTSKARCVCALPALTQ